MSNTLYFHEDDEGAQLHQDQALLWDTPMSELPVTPDEISVELFLVNAGISFQSPSCLHYGQECIKVWQWTPQQRQFRCPLLTSATFSTHCTNVGKHVCPCKLYYNMSVDVLQVSCMYEFPNRILLHIGVLK